MKNPPYIHPTAEVFSEKSLGMGTKVWHHAQIMEGADIGSDCVVGKGVFISGPTRVGNRVKIQNYANIFGGTIEDEVLIGPLVSIIHDAFPRSTDSSGELKNRSQYVSDYSLIKRGSSVGAGAVILPGVTVGNFAMIAAGSVVYRDVANYALVIGNPARQLGYVCSCGYRLDNGLTCSKCGRRYKSNKNSIDPVV